MRGYRARQTLAGTVAIAVAQANQTQPHNSGHRLAVQPSTNHALSAGASRGSTTRPAAHAAAGCAVRRTRTTGGATPTIAASPRPQAARRRPPGSLPPSSGPGQARCAIRGRRADRCRARRGPSRDQVSGGPRIRPGAAPGAARSAAAAWTAPPGRPEWGTYVMARTRLPSPAPAVIEDTIPTGSDPGVIPIERCRRLLGTDGLEMSDQDVDALRHHAHAMAHVLIEFLLVGSQRG